MATSDSSSPSIPAVDSLSSAKENLKPMNERIRELHESRAELMNRLQSLKQDLHNWRSKLDTQVKIYRDDLSELRKSLNIEVEQLRSEFQGLRATLNQQQQDLTSSLNSLGLHDSLRNEKRAVKNMVKVEDADSNNIGENQADSLIAEMHAVKDSKTEGHVSESEAFPSNGGHDVNN